MKYQSTKTYGHELGLSCCFRQWSADSHCHLFHGYALSFKLTFEAEELDSRNWVIDFGGLKEVKTWLESQFDHTLVMAEDDPHKRRIIDTLTKGDNVARIITLPRVGCEAFAEHVGQYVEDWLVRVKQAHRVRLHSVECREHGANSGLYFPDHLVDK